MSPVPRRRFLQGLPVVLTAGMAGCSSINPFACPDHRAVVIETNTVETTPENPIRFDSLPAAQQSFFRTALEDGEYRECPYSDVENEQALDELTSTVADHASDETAYLEYHNDYYALSVRVQDGYYSLY